MNEANLMLRATMALAREYRKGNWTLHETLILITAKKLEQERRLRTASSSSTRHSGELRWKWVENYCWTHGCFRSQNQCNDKWDNLLRDYKKVRHYEELLIKPKSSNFHCSSYWTMEKHQRKDRKLPSNMLLQVYQAVTHVLQNKLHPLPLPQPLPLLTLPPPPPPQPTLLLSVSERIVIVEGSESSGSEETQSKRRKYDEKVGSSIMRSAWELAGAIERCEEKKEKRHREMMELQQRHIQIEETRNQLNQQEITNLVNAVTNLTAAIQSLINSFPKHNASSSYPL